MGLEVAVRESVSLVYCRDALPGLLISGVRSEHLPLQGEAANKLIRITDNRADKTLKLFANRSQMGVEPFPQLPAQLQGG